VAQIQGAELSMKTRTTPPTGAAVTPSEICDLATPLTDNASLDPLLASIGDARFVPLGEASHRTRQSISV
jgi:erythromycin esterase-like protein